MALNKWIALVATESDLALLNEIAKQDGDAGKSATVRRLIRDEAKRRQIQLPAHLDVEALIEAV